MISRKKRPFVKFALLFLCGVVVYNEWFVYVLSEWTWPKMDCGDMKEFYKVLLVADPQILGENSEPWIARWDNDRYLFKTFSSAFHHVKPHLIIFLGDLMDEGSIASPDQYERYMERFAHIFSLKSIPSNMTIFLPGDNDIGGEDEQVTRFKVSRFNSHFKQPSIFTLDSIEFIKVNKLQHEFPRSHKLSDDKTRVVLSHIPLLGLPSGFSAEAVVRLHPHMIFSAHDHKSVHFAGELSTGERTLVEPLNFNYFSDSWPTTWRFQLTSHTVNEVIVPTCSYRMGTLKMGYGAAVIDKKGDTLCYSVLVLPSRFHLIYLYILALIIVFVVIFFNFFFSVCCSSCSRLSYENSRLMSSRNQLKV
ncbi:hypothetical protein LSTR_LSTR009636 [Laodelphax striatellus]|uniref:Calcineurin-like phosphoesterase domain-containing protein n=1 Tax=Laodelphax striatellus TaxID=195883 RepID=A0A482WND7_LAOST|nr:hypothetical protein LSTR_LSTR009636 [Laodelphax striatellus]